jgi:hypothetical protein
LRGTQLGAPGVGSRIGTARRLPTPATGPQRGEYLGFGVALPQPLPKWPSGPVTCPVPRRKSWRRKEGHRKLAATRADGGVSAQLAISLLARPGPTRPPPPLQGPAGVTGVRSVTVISTCSLPPPSTRR